MKKYLKITLASFCLSCLFQTGQSQLLLTIDKALDIAQENSPDIRIAFMELERYQYILFAQRASLKSAFSLDLSPVSYEKNRRFDNRLSQWYTNETFNTGATFQVVQPILWTDGTLSLRNVFSWQDNKSELESGIYKNKAFSNRLYLQLDQPIFTHNTRKMALKRIENDYENAHINYALQRLRSEQDITTNFYRVYTSQSSLQISKEELNNAEESYEIIKNKVEADLSAKDELFQAELNLATAKSAVEDAIVNLENQKDALKQTLGLPLTEEIYVTTDIHIEPININMEEAIRSGLSSRLELRQREIESQDLEFQMIETKADNEFKGNIGVSFGLMGDNKDFSKIYDNPTQNPVIAVTFSVPIFDWGRKKALVKAKKIQQNRNKIETEEERIDIELNIRQVWRELEKCRTQISIAEQNVKNAQLTYDLNLTRYREGDITGMEMNQFQTQLSSKKMAYTQALIDYKIALLNLKILSLYDFENNIPIVPLKDYSIKK